jgi:hypothetical protein
VYVSVRVRACVCVCVYVCVCIHVLRLPTTYSISRRHTQPACPVHTPPLPLLQCPLPPPLLMHTPRPPLLTHHRILQESNAGTYIWTQLMLGIMYLMYFVLQCLALCQSKALDIWCVPSVCCWSYGPSCPQCVAEYTSLRAFSVLLIIRPFVDADDTC